MKDSNIMAFKKYPQKVQKYKILIVYFIATIHSYKMQN